MMSGRSSVVVDKEQRVALAELANSRERAEADRARCILLTLSGWSSPRLAEAFGVREDTVRLWRMTFMTGGVDALRARVPPGPVPVKALRALEVAEEVLSAPVADRPNWTLPRLADEIEKRSGVRISRSRLSVVLRKKILWGVGSLSGGRLGSGHLGREAPHGPDIFDTIADCHFSCNAFRCVGIEPLDVAGGPAFAHRLQGQPAPTGRW